MQSSRNEIISANEYTDNELFSRINAMFVVSPNAFIQKVNPAACNLLGFKEEELLGESMDKLFAREKKESSFKKVEFDELIQKGFVRNEEKTLLSKAGRKIPVLFSSFVVKDEKERIKGIACLVEDITELKKVEEALRGKNLELEQLKKNLEIKVQERTKELERANKELSRLNEIKSNFISVVSHELRTPLTAIKSFAEILLDDIEEIDVESQKKYLGIIDRESDRLDRLISDILDLQKIDAGKMVWINKKINLVDIAQSSLDSFSVAYQEKGLSLSLEAENNLLFVMGNSDKIKQVFTNFLSNALKFTEKGGVKIKLRETGIAREKQKRIIIEVSVSDTGIGIPIEAINKIFERFYQVDSTGHRQQGGSGLGLSICKEIIEHYQGRLWVKSRTGQGSTFFFTLPESQKKKKLGEILVESGLLTTKQLSKALKKQDEKPNGDIRKSGDEG